MTKIKDFKVIDVVDEIPLFPEYFFDVRVDNDYNIEIIIKTYLRIEGKDSRMYKVLSQSNHKYNPNSVSYMDKNSPGAISEITKKIKKKVLKEFFNESYKTLVLLELPNNLINSEGDPLFPLDTDQRTEKERLKS